MEVSGSPFSGAANSRKLTDKELTKAIRFMIAAEFEATQLCVKLAESTDNKLAVAVLKDIAEEEQVHMGKFMRLIYKLANYEKKYYTEEAGEVERVLRKLKKKNHREDVLVK